MGDDGYPERMILLMPDFPFPYIIDWGFCLHFIRSGLLHIRFLYAFFSFLFISLVFLERYIHGQVRYGRVYIMSWQQYYA